MCTYLSKSKNEYSQSIKHATLEAMGNKFPIYDQIRLIAHTYQNKRECRIQECEYHILSGQCLRKIHPTVIFANSKIPENQFQICLSEYELSSLPDNSIC